MVKTDKTQYSTGEELTVSGYLDQKKIPVIAMRVYDPDGTILLANSIEIDEFNTFTKTLALDSPFFEKPGTYLIKFDYGKTKEKTTFEILGEKLVQGEPKVDETKKIIPKVLTLGTDKSSYQDNDFVTITGSVSAIGEPAVLVGIYDPFGTPTGFYFGNIGPDLKFSISFLVKNGINFKTQGSYIVKAHYGESKYETSFSFIKTEQPNNNNPIVENNKEIKPYIDLLPQKKPEVKTVSNTYTAPSPPINQNVNQNINPKIVEPQKSEPTKNIPEKNLEVRNNLTVKDIELGKMLNQMALNCDTSEYTDSIAYYDGMGPALMRLCKYNSAIVFFDKSLDKDPKNIEVLTNKGSALAKLGQYDEAITYYDLALKIKSNYLPAMNNKANALAQTGDLKKAVSLYNLVLDREPDYTTVQKNLGKANEKIRLLIKSQELESENSLVQVSEKSSVPLNKINSEIKKPTNILEQIGNVFSFLGSNVFGFMKS